MEESGFNANWRQSPLTYMTPIGVYHHYWLTTKIYYWIKSKSCTLFILQTFLLLDALGGFFFDFSFTVVFFTGVFFLVLAGLFLQQVTTNLQVTNYHYAD